MPIDYKRYPPNWKTYIVPTVLARAKNCCEECGLENKKIVYAIKLWVRDGTRYKLRTLWFRHIDDAFREADEPDDVRKIKVVLTIAHLDHDETNMAVEIHRLKAWCQICHLRYDAKEKYQRSLKAWETVKETP